MRVVIFSTRYFPHSGLGGAEVAIKEITDRVSGVDFELLTARLSKHLPKKEKVGNVLVHRVGWGSRLDKYLLAFFGIFTVRRIINERKVNLFWVVMASFSAGGAYMHNLFSRQRVPIVLTLQEGSSERRIERGRLGLIGIAWRLALSNADFLTVISSYLGQRARFFGYKGEMALVPNGVDVRSFSKKYSDSEMDALKSKLGLKESNKVIITTSRLEVKNGIKDVIDAMPLLPENYHFVVVGSGSLEKSLKDRAKDRGVYNRINFVGSVEHAEIPLYLSISDVFIRPSLSEGMGNSFIEAMAAGVPVIATPVGGIVDFIFDPHRNSEVSPTGIFVEPENSESIASGIRKILGDSSLRNDIITNAKSLVDKRYDWGNIAKKMEKVLKDNI
jgi:glycosyltransferase involved in cell wall biosynthesis